MHNHKPTENHVGYATFNLTLVVSSLLDPVIQRDPSSRFSLLY